MMLNTKIDQAWSVIAPVWPLKSFVAANPLQGFEHLPFEEAVNQGAYYFSDHKNHPNLLLLNRETIKWCQAFFDDGQALITMPHRALGLYRSFIKLAVFDKQLHKNDSKKIEWLHSLPEDPMASIEQSLAALNLEGTDIVLLLQHLLASLPGWAGVVQYQVSWANDVQFPMSHRDYLAFRLVLAVLLCPEIKDIFLEKKVPSVSLAAVESAEKTYRSYFLEKLNPVFSKDSTKPKAQFVFCIDVRSEPFRRALESQGGVETFGFAGFFGLPVSVQEHGSSQAVASCPVLLKPVCQVKQRPQCSDKACRADVSAQERGKTLKNFYNGLKLNFTTPFSLAEFLGPWCGLWLSLKTLLPDFSFNIKNRFKKTLMPALDSSLLSYDISSIDFSSQCQYAENALRMMGLMKDFAPVIVFCGHGSTSQNNPYASSLDCGACGGRDGAANAQILADILNQVSVRSYLEKQGIVIPIGTRFFGAFHNTTTDDVLFNTKEDLSELKKDLLAAKVLNQLHQQNDALDWAQTRPEWGLARNASFVVGPRDLTRMIDLEGRSFLHSYDWTIDPDGALLETILTAPMVVAQWINSQYFFASFDPATYGSGSKVTQNVTGKMGVMQGNASDLMWGLPRESIMDACGRLYHEPLRLLTIVYAPITRLDTLIKKQPVLQKLFGNGWVYLSVIDPSDEKKYNLQRDLTWHECL